MKIFYSASTKIRYTIQGEPEQEVSVKPGKERLAEKYASQAGHCLITTGLDTMSGIITAVYSDTPSLGVAFCPIITEDKKQAKAYTLYLNSVMGWLSLLRRRSGGQLTFPNWSHTALRKIPVPNKRDLCDYNVLLNAFDDVKHERLKPLGLLREDPVRERIDRATASALGVSWSYMDALREKLANEPTITKMKSRVMHSSS